MSNITQIVNVDKYLKVLKKGVHASDMDQVLSSTGPYTFFAPNDLAFEKLEKGLMDTMLEVQNRTKLKDFINNHVVEGKIVFTDLKDGDTLTALSGKVIKIQVENNAVSIGDTKVTARDTKVSNGVVHILDTVLL